ncbi:hypothetical protein [Tissierella sp.]|uniref:hypothetical protein n=1 Tax=Tissierella sp. TaxID=41274 RepID=UPI00285AC5C7|nr:hypothetical protein [Tissierella sp.]MDR7856037.1 hypothetical protein [Tissierella sp.]
MKDYQVMNFTKTFSGINLALKKSDEKSFDYAALLIYINECNKGFKVNRINKTTKGGTSVVYELIKDEADMSEYKKLVGNKVKEFNNKWNEELTLI